ncbi:prepilin-type N-terminal cleavage/methylation domain-containing protein [Noviherbaspirillum aerium]|uniref:prepilin-type N-terminal cleavage/methylation domain-containing protein n=1 Tax=Noviherbaspirillum aerium TaxID=2588497 RepID=UPI00124E464E|nr:prepilin-type N-terminal cleavage/methylation domain-containing protein [Noviherbaspirillum aerium]
MKTQRGFTLIELLVSIMVLAIVAVLGWRGLDSIVRARVALNADLDQTRGMQLAFAQMQSDLDHIAVKKNIGSRSVLSSQAGRVTLVRSVYAENQPTRVQVVAYRIRDGLLTRRESLATRNLLELDTAWRAMLADTDNSAVVQLTTDVVAMPVRIFIPDNQGWRPAVENAASMSGTPAGTTVRGLPNAPLTTTEPTGLEVTLQLRDRPAGLVKVFLVGVV